MIEGIGITPDVVIPAAEMKPARSNGDRIDLQDTALLNVVSALGHTLNLIATPAPISTPPAVQSAMTGINTKLTKSSSDSTPTSSKSQLAPLATKKIPQSRLRAILTKSAGTTVDVE